MFHVLIWILLRILVLGGVSLCLFVFLGLRIGLAAQSLQIDLPILKWVTFTEVLDIGHSPFITRMALQVLYDAKQLEVRILSHLDIPSFNGRDLGKEFTEKLQELNEVSGRKTGKTIVDYVGITQDTEDLFEYRLITRMGKKKFRKLFSLPKLAWQPVPIRSSA